jgi:hypothetical protein
MDFIFGNWFWSIGDVFFALILLSSVALYVYRDSFSEKFAKRCVFLAKIAAAARIFGAGFLTAAQYFVWNQNEISRTFLTAPADGRSLEIYGFLAPVFNWRMGYFTLYSFTRFWLPAIASVLTAYLFFLFLRGLRRRKERFFEDGEVELGWVLALVAGYPKFIVFVPLIFLLIIPVSLFRMAFLRQNLTTVGYPMIIGAVIASMWGIKIIDVLGWGALKA